MGHAEDMGPHVVAGVRSGSQAVHALMATAVTGEDPLRAATLALSEDQARWALSVLAWWDAEADESSGGVRVVVDDSTLDELRMAATAGGFRTLVGAVLELGEAEARAALANLVALHVDLRRDAATAAMN